MSDPDYKKREYYRKEDYTPKGIYIGRDRNNDPDRIRLNPDFEDGGRYASAAGLECESKGGEWVDGHDTRYGYVHGYCRKKKHSQHY